MLRFRLSFLCFAFVFSLAVTAGKAEATTFWVNSAADEIGLSPGNGTCETAPGNGVCTLRRALHEANALFTPTPPGPSVVIVLDVPGGVVTLAPGSAPLGVDNLKIGQLTLLGAGPDRTILDGDRTHRAGAVFSFYGFSLKSVTLVGLTIRNGATGIEGVGALTLQNVHVRDNVGCGVFWSLGSVSIEDSVVADNDATGSSGGGVKYLSPDASDLLRIRRSTISGNVATAGGGIASNKPVEIIDSLFHNNRVVGTGGAMLITTMDGAQSTIVNSTVNANRADDGGGGIALLGGSLKIFSTTITDNQADANLNGFGAGGGVLVQPGASLTMANTILGGNRKSVFSGGVWAQVGGECAGTLNSDGFNLMAVADCTVIGPAPIIGDPLLAPLGNNGGRTFTRGVITASPAFDAGDPAGCSDGAGGTLRKDQRGLPRDGLCDIGAFERGAVAPPRARPRDVNGDGHADLVWRNRDTGQNAAWLMTGATIDSAVFLPTVPNPNWRLVGSDDFDADGKADLLWVHAPTGLPAVWLMDGGLIHASALLPKPEPEWQVAGVGDFDGDRRADIVWQAPGRRMLWLMDGVMLQAVRPLPAAGPWTIVGAGDIDGDLKTDLIWRLPATGDMAAWLMDGATILAAQVLPAMTEAGVGVVAVADLSGDGNADVLWRNALTGAVFYWRMDGFVILHTQALPTVADLGWQPAPPGDTDGDGATDLLWRHSVTGQNALWRMDAGIFGSGHVLTPVPAAAWEIR
jgi:hypothetical protein